MSGRQITSLFIVLSALALSICGCFNRAADHCRGCFIASRLTPPPSLDAEATARVVLVGGGFGFGDEWQPVIDALKTAQISFYVFEWPGPGRDSLPPARSLARALQNDLDHAPSLRRLVVLSHSAGGTLAGWAIRRIRVPTGRQLLFAAIAAPRDLDLAPFVPDDSVNTPLGLAVGGVEQSTPPLPSGVIVVEYLTQERPLHPKSGTIYLGSRVSHDQSVAVASLPLVRALALPGDFWYR